MASENLVNAISGYERYIERKGIDEQAINAYSMAVNTAYIDEKDLEYGKKLSARAKELIVTFVKSKTGGTPWDLEKYCFKNKTNFQILDTYYGVIKTEAQYGNLESYLMYLEKKREPKDRFYMPKRKQFAKIGLIQGLQDMIDDKADVLCISLPPGTGKTTLSKFFISAVMGWFPNDYNLFFSHSADICRMYYDGVLSIISDDEYAWHDIFPDLQVTGTNAKMMNINIGNYKPFQNLMCGSRGSELAGKVRCSKFLMVDDLIGKQEEALNKNILEKIWSNDYTTDALQRKIEGCKEIHIATRWSVWDVIGRLQMIYDGNDRARFIAVPDIDEETGESNFDYEYGGFSTEFFHSQQLLMDDITYGCLYKQQPMEREGLLYHEEDLRRYLTLPEREPDAIIGICDTKAKGTDFMFLPCCYQYDDDYYCVDCVCNDSSDFGVQEELCASLILRHQMQQCQFESNVGGDRFASNVAKRVEQESGRCNITTKPTESNKETKIIVNADWVKKHVLFKDKSMYSPKDEYGVMMKWLMNYSVTGKNAHDDIPDGWAMFALFATAGNRTARVEAVMNPFRRR